MNQLNQQVAPERLWSQIVAKAWSDEDFKRRVVSEPEVVFDEYGLELPEGMEAVVLHDTPTIRHFILPVNPDGELMEEELAGTGEARDCFSGYSGFCGRCGRCGCGCGRCFCD